MADIMASDWTSKRLPGLHHITVLYLLFVFTCLSSSLYSSFWMTLQQREADFLTALSELQLCEQIHQLEQTKKPPYKLIT